MTISDERLIEFRNLYRAEFGIALAENEAKDAAERIVCLIGAVFATNEYEEERMD